LYAILSSFYVLIYFFLIFVFDFVQYPVMKKEFVALPFAVFLTTGNPFSIDRAFEMRKP